MTTDIKDINEELNDATELVKQYQTDLGSVELEKSSKHQKTKSLTHANNRGLQRADESSESRKPLTLEHLRKVKNDILPNAREYGASPEYKYKWFSMDANGRSDYHRALTQLNYTPVTIQDCPALQSICIRSDKIDPSITTNHIVVKEMILLKIHVDDWATIMSYNHQDKPAEQEENITSNYKAMFHRFGDLDGLEDLSVMGRDSILGNTSRNVKHDPSKPRPSFYQNRDKNDIKKVQENFKEASK